MMFRYFGKLFGKGKDDGRWKGKCRVESDIVASSTDTNRKGLDGDMLVSTSELRDRNHRGSADGKVTSLNTPSGGPGQAADAIQTSGDSNSNCSTEVHQETTGVISPATSSYTDMWDEAYGCLKVKTDTAEFVDAYEKIISRLFPTEMELQESSSEGQSGENAVAPHPPLREQQMKRIVEKGLQRIEKAKDATEIYGKIFESLKPFKAVLDVGLKNVPPVALPWAVVSSTLDILEKPAKSGKALYSGVSQVVSRMDWYSSLADQLLRPDSIHSGKPLELARSELRKRIVDLYEALLFYQIKSVCYYYRHQFFVFIRGLMGLDDWSGGLGDLTRAEEILRNDSQQYNKEHIKVLLESILITAKDQNGLLREMDREKEDRQCLRDLRLIDPRDQIEDIKDREDTLVEDSYKWILATDEYKNFVDWEDPTSPSLLWISGQAGTGKTMLMVGVVQDIKKRRLVSLVAPDISYFFCQGTNEQLGNASAALRSLLWLLLLQQPQLISHVRKEYETSGQKLFEDSLALKAMGRILEAMLEDHALDRVFLLIDALDECDEKTRQQLLDTVLSTTRRPSRFKWLISSRPLREIEIKMTRIGKPIKHLKLDEYSLERPIQSYIDYKVLQLRSKEEYGSDHLNDLASEMRQRASNTFLWVALVCKELSRTEDYLWSDIIETVPKQLTELYNYLLERIENLEWQRESEYCKKVLTVVALACRETTLDEVASLAGLSPGATEAVVNKCGSFLTVRKNTVYLIHQSAHDYLSGNLGRLHKLAPESAHLELFQLCLKVQIPGPDPLSSVRYACRYWVHHLQQSNVSVDDRSEVYRFLQVHFLHWLEALSLIGAISESVSLIITLQSLVKLDEDLKLSQLLYDARCLALQNRAIIETAPLQLYASVILFAPERSIIRSMFKDQIPEWIDSMPKTQPMWSPELQKLQLHTDRVKAVAFSSKAQLLASASDDNTIRLWVPGQEQELLVLNGHTRPVRAIAFSPDGQLLVSASEDRSIRLWDPVNGLGLQILGRHKGWVNAVAFSSNGQLLASASDDKTVKVWHMTTQKELQTLNGHEGYVRAIGFTPGNQLLASASADATVRLWDPVKGQQLQVFKGHEGPVRAVIFSLDGQMLASASSDTTIRLWDLATGTEIQTLKGHTATVNAIAFSHNNQVLASASDDGSIWLWDPRTGRKLQKLEGHSDSVSAVAFSGDDQLLASASHDETVRLWNPNAWAELHEADGHTDWVNDVTFSGDGRLLASASSDRTVGLWNPATGEQIQKFEGHAGWVSMVTFSHNSQLLASVDDSIVRLWNPVTGKELQRLYGHTGSINAVMFSQDGQLLASASSDKTIWLWGPERGEVIWELKGHTQPVKAIALSRGQLLASGSDDNTVRLWDLVTGKEHQRLYGHTGSINAVVFSQDSQLLASASSDKTIRLWDPEKGKEIGKFEGHTQSIRAIAFSQDGRLLASASSDKTIRLWNLTKKKELQKLMLVTDTRKYFNTV
ncbi:hypothetical protein N7472_003011 [Penicillium cf. griseofulvum]|uniref:Mitochondrial division protein 1 n=1 Tax=Penicillium cf. griseofulvum TaxID=2972120 RepID=A0A9W9MSD7_9EURO|nr:hypothetical protein N7472_003011 [Penicillium cf. griseofulvum]